MPAENLRDDVVRLAREVWRLNMVIGWQARIGWDDGHAIGRLAQAAGAELAQVEAWMRGESQPTTNQALCVLDALPLPETRAPALDGAVRTVTTSNGARS